MDVAWEALLRAERMADRQALPPAALFASLRTAGQRMALDLRGLRAHLRHFVQTLHECGALVMMEGIETLLGAHVALNCDVELVQGHFLGRPGPEAGPHPAPLDKLAHAWSSFDPALMKEPADIGRHLCRTLSVAFERAGSLQVLCADLEVADA